MTNTAAGSNTRPACATISVVLPLYNEGAVLRRLADAVRDAISAAGCRYELIFVNDGSTDASGSIIDQLAAEDAKIRAVHFSRNFGHQAAVQAGLAQARGDAVVMMDTDLQDDPAFLPHMIARWRDGYDVVYAVRTQRKEAWWKRVLFSSYYRLLHRISDIALPKDAGNFSLLDRSAAAQILAMAETDRYFPGLRHWVGFRQIGLPVERLARHDGTPRVSLWGLVRLAKTAVFSFSRFPLAIFYVIALLSLGACGVATLFTLYHRLWTNLAIPGWTSLTITASFFGAINALGIAILGEYVVRIYDQVRQRPSYIVARVTGFEPHHDLRQEQQLLGTARELQAAAAARTDNEQVTKTGNGGWVTSEPASTRPWSRLP